MRNFSYVSDVAEGEFVTFSCTIEKASGDIILWRVGTYTVQCYGGTVALPGTGMNINCNITETEWEVIEVLGIEATPGSWWSVCWPHMRDPATMNSVSLYSFTSTLCGLEIILGMEGKF